MKEEPWVLRTLNFILKAMAAIITEKKDCSDYKALLI